MIFSGKNGKNIHWLQEKVSLQRRKSQKAPEVTMLQ